MDQFVLMALIASLGTWFITALGAATIAFFKSPNPTALNVMLGFASGVMIAASFWSLLQPAIERAEAAGGTPAWLVATAGFLFGALFMWASDKAVSVSRLRIGSGNLKADHYAGAFHYAPQYSRRACHRCRLRRIKKQQRITGKPDGCCLHCSWYRSPKFP